jgi:ABC-2 type transport system ATP-binding protein
MDPMVSVEHLVKRYRKSTVAAVDDISFQVHPGELFAFLGGTVLFVRSDRNR